MARCTANARRRRLMLSSRPRLVFWHAALKQENSDNDQKRGNSRMDQGSRGRASVSVFLNFLEMINHWTGLDWTAECWLAAAEQHSSRAPVKCSNALHRPVILAATCEAFVLVGGLNWQSSECSSSVCSWAIGSMRMGFCHAGRSRARRVLNRAFLGSQMYS